MMKFDVCRGSLVYSRAGRDNGKLFLVMSQDGDYVYLADGDVRTVESQKKKKFKHINKTNVVLEMDFDNITNSDVRKALAAFSIKE